MVRKTGVAYVLSKSFVDDIGLTLSTRVASNAPVDALADATMGRLNVTTVMID